MLIFNAHLEIRKFISVQGFSQFHTCLISKDGKSSSLHISYCTGSGKKYTSVSDSLLGGARYSVMVAKHPSL